MGKIKILLVDDNKDDFLIISRMLKDECELSYSDGSKDVLELITEQQPDCLLLDFHIGTLSGMDVLKKIRTDKNINTIPVMILTNETDPEVIVNCMKEGADDYVVKDKIEKSRLLVSINIIVEKSQLQKRINTLESLLPICANCKKMREPGSDSREQKSWMPIENYITKHTSSVFSHGMCPECMQELYGEFLGDKNLE